MVSNPSIKDNKEDNIEGKLQSHEKGLVEQFRKHPILAHLSNLSDSKLYEILLQRRFLSVLGFTPAFDLAIDNLLGEYPKSVVRRILREEYPLNAPSHREDLVSDLRKMGIPHHAILLSNPTMETSKAVQGVYTLVSPITTFDLSDVIVVSALRMVGEVFVSEEYGLLLPELERRFGLTKEISVFYWPHFEHDSDHADQLKEVRSRLIQSGDPSVSSRAVRMLGCDSPQRAEKEILGEFLGWGTLVVNGAKKAMDQAYEVKTGFYDQFVKKER